MILKASEYTCWSGWCVRRQSGPPVSPSSIRIYQREDSKLNQAIFRKNSYPAILTIALDRGNNSRPAILTLEGKNSYPEIPGYFKNADPSFSSLDDIITVTVPIHTFNNPCSRATHNYHQYQRHHDEYIQHLEGCLPSYPLGCI